MFIMWGYWWFVDYFIMMIQFIFIINYQMLSNRVVNSTFRNLLSQQMNLFSAKKKQMELTLRTPYRTIVQDFTGFSRIIMRDISGMVLIQNRSPATIHVLPPGFLKLKLSGQSKGVAEQYIHTGGWAIIHTDNSVEINLMEAVDKKQIKPELVDKVQLKDQDTLAGKYITKVRRTATKAISKRLT